MRPFPSKAGSLRKAIASGVIVTQRAAFVETLGAAQAVVAPPSPPSAPASAAPASGLDVPPSLTDIVASGAPPSLCEPGAPPLLPPPLHATAPAAPVSPTTRAIF